MNKYLAKSAPLFLLLLIISFAINILLVYKNYIDIPPNHPHSQWHALFPGLLMDPVRGPDLQQTIFNSFVFITNNTTETEQPRYNFRLINRHGCRIFYGGTLPKQEIDLAPWVNKAVILRDFDVTKDGDLILHDIELDTFVMTHLDEYKEACGMAFDLEMEH